MHIGLFGGTFDPVHTGHLIIAETIRCNMNLDKVIFIPAAVPPHKQGRDITPAKDRIEMLHLAVNNHDCFQVSDYEIRQGGLSFTVDTVVHFQETYPENRFCLIIGSDSLHEIQTWKDPEKIFRLLPVAVAVRPGFDLKNFRSGFVRKSRSVQTPLIQISSTYIREATAANRSIRYLVPESVENYIQQRNLYH